MIKCTYCTHAIDLNDPLGYGYSLGNEEWAIRKYHHMECLEIYEDVRIV